MSLLSPAGVLLEAGIQDSVKLTSKFEGSGQNPKDLTCMTVYISGSSLSMSSEDTQ